MGGGGRGREKGRTEGQREGGKEREQVKNNNNITHHIKQNIQDWVSIYQQNFYNVHTIHDSIFFKFL